MAKIDIALPTADKDNVKNPFSQNWPKNSINQFEELNPGSDTCVHPGASEFLKETERWLFQRKAMDY